MLNVTQSRIQKGRSGENFRVRSCSSPPIFAGEQEDKQLEEEETVLKI